MFKKIFKFSTTLTFPFLVLTTSTTNTSFKHKSVYCEEKIQNIDQSNNSNTNQINNSNKITLDFATHAAYKKYLTKLHSVTHQGYFLSTTERDFANSEYNGFFCSADHYIVKIFWKYKDHFYSKKLEIKLYLFSVENIVVDPETKLFISKILEYIELPIKLNENIAPIKKCAMYRGLCYEPKKNNCDTIQNKITHYNNNVHNKICPNSSKITMSTLNYDDDELIKLMHYNEEIKNIVIAIYDILNQPIHITNVTHTTTYIRDDDFGP